jgi:phospholipase D1/2
VVRELDHSQVKFVRQDPGDGFPTGLGDLILAVLDRNPELELYVLLWSYAPIYALEREPLLFGDTPWDRHPRLHFVQDDTPPLTASHHQKVVAVDGRIAFCGGLDLSKWRWDTSEHLADDGRRSDPHGKPHPPFHPLRVQHAGTARDPRPAYTPAGGYDLRIVSSALTIVPEAIVTCSRRPETGWHFGGY